MRRPALLLLLLLATGTSLSPAYTLSEGASRAELVSTYGYPLSQAKTGEREILNYREGSVVLEKSRVVEFRFTRGEPPILRRLPTIQAPPQTNSLPQRVPERIVAPIKTSAPVVQSRPITPTPPPALSTQPTGFGIWTIVAPAMGIMFLAIAALKLTFSPKLPARSSAQKPAAIVPPISKPPVIPSPRVEITKLSREALDRLEWRRFEELIHGYFETQNWKAQRSRVGADGGIDIFLYRPGEYKPAACVQCKAWHTYNVGVKPVRELLGVMTANNIAEGYFVTTGNYTEEALAFKTANLHLLSGHEVLNRFNALPSADHQKVVQHAFRGDFETPTCPSCDEKMILKQAETPFWGCRNFPRCRKTFKVRVGS